MGARRRWHAHGLERLDRHDPRRHRRGERLTQKRAERYIFPRLDIARRPIVDQTYAEQVTVGVVQPDRLTDRRFAADDDADLGFDVEARRRAELNCTAGFAALAVRASYRGSRLEYGAGTAVITDRQMFPIGRQRLGVRPEDPPDIAGMLFAGVKVDVITDGERHRQLHLFAVDEVLFDYMLMRVVANPFQQRLAHVMPGFRAGGQERIQSAAREELGVPRHHHRGGTGEIENVFVNRDADPTAAFARYGERAVRQGKTSEITHMASTSASCCRSVSGSWMLHVPNERNTLRTRDGSSIDATRPAMESASCESKI